MKNCENNINVTGPNQFMLLISCNIPGKHHRSHSSLTILLTLDIQSHLLKNFMLFGHLFGGCTVLPNLWRFPKQKPTGLPQTLSLHTLLGAAVQKPAGSWRKQVKVRKPPPLVVNLIQPWICMFDAWTKVERYSPNGGLIWWFTMEKIRKKSP